MFNPKTAAKTAERNKLIGFLYTTTTLRASALGRVFHLSAERIFQIACKWQRLRRNRRRMPFDPCPACIKPVCFIEK